MRSLNERLLRRTLAAWGTFLSPLDPGNLAEGPRAEVHERLLVDIAQELARTYRGRRIDVEYGGGHVRAVVEAIRLDRRDEGWAARLRLGGADWDGVRFESLSVVADAVSLTPPPDVALTVSGVELEGRTALVPLLARLAHEVRGWRLGVTEDGLVEAIAQRGGRRFEVEPVVVDGELEVELRAVRWRGLRIRLPAWLRLTRAVPLPALPEGMSVSHARRRGTSVDLRLSVPAVSRRVDAGCLLEARSRWSR